MHKIDGDGNVAGQFAAENPATGQQPTVITAEWLNAVQNELVSVILGAGLVLDKADSGQLFKAVKALIDGVVAGAPGALDTLKELSTALGNDPNFAATMVNALAGKAARDGSNATGKWPIGIAGNADTASKIAAAVTGSAAVDLVYAGMADNDVARIRVGGGASNAGWLEIATADDGTEPIFVRQYAANSSGPFGAAVRTLVLLDSSGNTSLPGSLSIGGHAAMHAQNVNTYAVGLTGNQTVDGVKSFLKPVHLGGDGFLFAPDLAATGNVTGISWDGYGAMSVRCNGVVVGQFTGSGYIGRVATADNGVPPGTIIYTAAANPPPGYLRANGATLLRSAYAALFAAIGVSYGAGDGSSTFRIPDLRGEFIRGLDDSRGVDAGRSLGSAQADEFRNHSHIVSLQHLNSNSDSGEGRLASGGQLPEGVFPDVATSSVGGSETRPRNIALLACIKF